MKPSTISLTRILHLEQDAKYAQLVQRSLTQCDQGHLEIVHTTNVDAALRHLAESMFDVVLMEPFGSERDALRIIHEICKCARPTPVVVLSENPDESLALDSMESGLQDYLIKGQVDGEGILKTIRFAIARSGQSQLAARATTVRKDGPLEVLLVEDNPCDALLIKAHLTRALDTDFKVTIVDRLDNALQLLSHTRFNAVVLDLSLPDSRGVETCVALRLQSPEIPFVVHTGSDDSTLALKTIEQGASDYLVKGRTSGGDLVRSIRFAIQRQFLCNKDAAATPPSPSSSPSRPRGAAERLLRLQTAVSSEVSITELNARVSPKADQRTCDRYSVIRSALVIPIGPGGRPDWDRRLPAVTSELSQEGLVLELDAAQLTSQTQMIGVERRDGVLCFAGLEVRNTQALSSRRLRVEGAFGGRGQEILTPASLTPKFDPVSMRLTHATDVDVLAAWCNVGVLRRTLLDRVQVCPRCSAVPTFRSGCRSCGSGRVTVERLIHHFACAHVGSVANFEQGENLVCPKCRTRKLIVGSDFEYQSGLVRCQDCHWSGTDMEQVGQCLQCGFRFPSGQALIQELTAYHVHRLDPLAFISAS